MIKVKDFWLYLCNDMDYRLFSGVPCLDLKPLYDNMSSQFLHYVPAVDEYSAFGISSGASVAGVKSGVIMDYLYLDSVADWVNFCKDKEVHLVVLTNKEIKSFPCMIVDSAMSGLKKFLNKCENKKVPGVLVLEDLQ
jgi:hypothetical protein